MDNNSILRHFEEMKTELQAKISNGISNLSAEDKKKLSDEMKKIDFKGQSEATINSVKKIFDTLK